MIDYLVSTVLLKVLCFFFRASFVTQGMISNGLD